MQLSAFWAMRKRCEYVWRYLNIFQTYGGLLLRIRQVYERHLLHLKRDLNFEAKEKQRWVTNMNYHSYMIWIRERGTQVFSICQSKTLTKWQEELFRAAVTDSKVGTGALHAAFFRMLLRLSIQWSVVYQTDNVNTTKTAKVAHGAAVKVNG